MPCRRRSSRPPGTPWWRSCATTSKGISLAQSRPCAAPRLQQRHSTAWCERSPVLSAAWWLSAINSEPAGPYVGRRHALARRRRREIVSELARAVRDAHGERGRPLSVDGEREVEATLEAAVADPSAAAALSGGRLTRGLQHSGIGPVDVEASYGAHPHAHVKRSDQDRIEAPLPSSSPTADASEARIRAAEVSEARIRAAEAAAAEAEEAFRVVAEHASDARARVAQARAALEDLERQAADARRLLDDASARRIVSWANRRSRGPWPSASDSRLMRPGSDPATPEAINRAPRRCRAVA